VTRFFPTDLREPGPWAEFGPPVADRAKGEPVAVMLLTSLFFVGLGSAWIMSREERQRPAFRPRSAFEANGATPVWRAAPNGTAGQSSVAFHAGPGGERSDPAGSERSRHTPDGEEQVLIVHK
jgi:hypothetical protein